MQHTHQHHEHIYSKSVDTTPKDQTIIRLAASATLHCLLGCGIGEVVGMIIAAYLGMSMVSSMILAIC